MADDIAPELLEKVQNEYRKLRESDKELAQISKRMEDGIADGKDLDAYAVREGELLARALHSNVSGDVLPNGKMYFNIADRVLSPVLEENYGNVSYMSQKIIAGMNERAGIHIAAQGPVLNADRVEGLVNLAATADQYENIRKELEADVVNFSQSVGTDTVRKNADFQYQSGLSPKIHRTAESGCCKWCSGLSGTYDYASVKGAGSDVWQRHRDCRCVVEFDPGNGKRQNAHTKAWSSDEDRAKRIQYDQESAARRLAENAEKIAERKGMNLAAQNYNPRQLEINASVRLGTGNTDKNGNTTREELDSINYRDAEEAIKFYGNAIRYMPTEHSIVIQRDGRVFHFEGDTKSVTPFDVDLTDAYITHNHPASNGIKSFGQDDFMVIQNNPDIERLECVNEKYDYFVKPLATIKDISYHDVMLEAYDYADILSDTDVQHAAMMLLNDGGYVIYERRGFDGDLP